MTLSQKGTFMLVSMYSYLFSRVLILAISKLRKMAPLKLNSRKYFVYTVGSVSEYCKILQDTAGYCKFYILIWLAYLPRSKIINSLLFSLAIWHDKPLFDQASSGQDCCISASFFLSPWPLYRWVSTSSRSIITTRLKKNLANILF